MADEFPSRTLDKIVIRVPDGMRDRIASTAKLNNRSMNAEIVSTLEQAYPAPDGEELYHFLDTFRRMKQQLKTGDIEHDKKVEKVVFDYYMHLMDNLDKYYDFTTNTVRTDIVRELKDKLLSLVGEDPKR